MTTVRIETRKESNGLWYVAVDKATGQEISSYTTRYGAIYLTQWLQDAGYTVEGSR